MTAFTLNFLKNTEASALQLHRQRHRNGITLGAYRDAWLPDLRHLDKRIALDVEH